MLAGCPAVVGNLWDVTDRDLDRFCVAHLGSWLQQDIVSDMISKAHKQDSGLSGRANNSQGQPALQIAAAVVHGRAACYLSSLVGAAPVCYGLPCSLSNSPATHI